METVSAAGALLAAGLHAAGGGSGFSQAVAGTGNVFLALLAIHVPAGLAAVISGALAAIAPKRRGWHTRVGTIYYWAIAVLRPTIQRASQTSPVAIIGLELAGFAVTLLATRWRHWRSKLVLSACQAGLGTPVPPYSGPHRSAWAAVLI